MAGLYVHVPFCSQRCVYCDFYFTTTRREEGPYTRALALEAERLGHEYRDRAPLRTLYLGGGTPSLLTPDALAAVIGAAHDHFDASGLEEVTVEANPEDLAGERGADWFGEAVRVELALAVATSQVFPILKRGLGQDLACALVQVEV